MKIKGHIYKSVINLALYYNIAITFLIAFSTLFPSLVSAHFKDSTPNSSAHQALIYLQSNNTLPQSAWWPNIKPSQFIENIRTNIIHPLQVYEGSNTNFCGYAALTYFPLHIDPLNYVKFMLRIYKDGKAPYGKVFIDPSSEIKNIAGTLRFKGTLDIRPADQLWFLSLADHFKGYVNFFNKNYDPGDENTFWASVNYAKFNRMVKQLFDLKIHARGSDLLHPSIPDLYTYIQNSMETGITVLYLNNAYLYRRKHNMLRPGVPTHYVILLDIQKINDVITIVYWDYGFRSLRQISPRFLKKIVFGISHCTLKN